MSPIEITFIVIQLIFLEGILSIDNAAVLGAMVSELPANEAIPWPKRLAFIQSWGDRTLGGQRAAALKVGLLGAYFGRALMLLMASFVIRNLWLRLLGAAYLFKLSLAHLAIKSNHSHGPDGEADEKAESVRGKDFWTVVLMVELADLAFSVDNVVAAVALSDMLWVVMLGVAFGIVTMRFAAQIFTVMIEKEPILAPTAYVLVLNIALELIIEETATLFGVHIHFAHWQKFVISIGTIALALLYARWPLLHRILQPVVYVIRRFFGLLDDGINLILRPIGWAFSRLFTAVRSHLQSGDSAAA
ncbi:MAG: tellurium resistance protein TerC [Chloroflexi bacterium]|nr:tellurium resistance protein TerC [Chloroflexota bacterium]